MYSCIDSKPSRLGLVSGDNEKENTFSSELLVAFIEFMCSFVVQAASVNVPLSFATSNIFNIIYFIVRKVI